MRTFTVNANAIEVLSVTGNGTLSTTIGAGAVVDNGDGTVKVAIAADVFAAGSIVYIEGTTNYNGLREVISAPAGYINIKAHYVAETLGGTETCTVAIAPNCPFELMEVAVKLNAVPTTSEDFTFTLDSILGANFDDTIITKDLSTLSAPSYIWAPDVPLIFIKGDICRAVWANTDGKTHGIKIKYRRLS